MGGIFFCASSYARIFRSSSNAGKTALWGLTKSSSPTRWLRISIIVCIVGTVIISLVTYRNWLYQEDPGKSTPFQAAHVARDQIPKDSLVIAVDKGNPMMLYYARKKGWHSFPQDLSFSWIQAHAKDGAEYIFGTHQDFIEVDSAALLNQLFIHHKVIVNNGQFFIVNILK